MTSGSKSTKPLQYLPIATALVLLIAAALAVRARRAPLPDQFVKSVADIDHASKVNGVWYWVEHRDPGHEVLMQVNESGAESDIFSGDEISDFAVGSEHVLVLSRIGKVWRVSIADSHGGSSRDVWSGVLQPHGAFIAGDAAYWLRAKSALRADAVVFPPLGPQVELVSSPLVTGESRVVSTIMEPQGDAVIGVSDGSIWLSARRDTQHYATTFYRVPIAGGPGVRVAGEMGRQRAILTPNGELYWTAPSREAQDSDQIICICKQGASGMPESVSEWLPAGGRLFYTHHGMYYIDGNIGPLVWPVTTKSDLPKSVPLADGFCVLAVGDNELLLKLKSDVGRKSPVYRMPQR